ncbi:BQ5605_C013g07110 [Microbotryum silenes-dioicae]|uniref:BQ5605_C013g07110 protein n=1 Tax=Microbotryum silenes-dioicae TaxID=796604 RepID=A0A2X0LUA4_9BASI|nr:BQ5605_C013g07110 [Microbotryum silenes-dioicae]
MIRFSPHLLAPVKERTTRLRSSSSSPLLPLDYFVNHAKSLSLYRSFIRATRNLGTLEARWHTIKWIRTDFERYKGLVDSVSPRSSITHLWEPILNLLAHDSQQQAKTLLSLGARQLKQLNSTASLIGIDGSKFRGTKSA